MNTLLKYIYILIIDFDLNINPAQVSHERNNKSFPRTQKLRLPCCRHNIRLKSSFCIFL